MRLSSLFGTTFDTELMGHHFGGQTNPLIMEHVSLKREEEKTIAMLMLFVDCAQHGHVYLDEFIAAVWQTLGPGNSTVAAKIPTTVQQEQREPTFDSHGTLSVSRFLFVGFLCPQERVSSGKR